MVTILLQSGLLCAPSFPNARKSSLQPLGHSPTMRLPHPDSHPATPECNWTGRRRGAGLSASFGKPDSGAARPAPRCRSRKGLGRHPPLPSLAASFIARTFAPALPMRRRVPGRSPPGGDGELDLA